MYGTDGRQEGVAVSLRPLAGTIRCLDHARGFLLLCSTLCERQVDERNCSGTEKFGLNDSDDAPCM